MSRPGAARHAARRVVLSRTRRWPPTRRDSASRWLSTDAARTPRQHVSRIGVVLGLTAAVLGSGVPALASTKLRSGSLPSILRDITTIPATTYNQVGITSSAESITPPVATASQPALRFTTQGGKDLPGFFIYCAEYAPFCASERWAVVAALSRFGTFRDLGIIESSPTDVFPSTPSLTFLRATFSSRYIAFKSDEYYGNKVSKNGNYVILQPLTPEERHLVETYDRSTFFPATLAVGENGFPFVDIGNKFLSLNEFSPAILAGLTAAEVAEGLSDPATPVTQPVVASANYLTAAICSVTDARPTSVCSSKGVLAAAAALGRSS
jgi:hypothetical protein